MIRNATSDDAAAICGIYDYYIRNTTITFEEETVPVEEMQNRIADVTAALPWLVAEKQGAVVGYAYAGKWHKRSAYRFSVESTVYVAQHARRQGIGRELYEALLGDLRSRSLHTVIAIVALPNPASVALHERMGFEKVGHLKAVGWKFGRWVDVGYWELVLNAAEPTSIR
jgi:L-amino acid N-acyltransferase YncA